MRIAVLLLLTFGLCRAALADKARDCYLKALQALPAGKGPVLVEPLGCFESFRSAEDRSSGYRVCLFLDKGQCSGLLYHYDANVEPDQALFDEGKCGGKGGAVSFATSKKWKTSFNEPGPVPLVVAFAGKIEKGKLRGRFIDAEGRKRVSWEKAIGGADFGEEQRRVRTLRTVVRCLAKK